MSGGHRVIEPDDHRPGWVEGLDKQTEQAPSNLVTTQLIAVEYEMVVGDVRRLIKPHALEHRAQAFDVLLRPVGACRVCVCEPCCPRGNFRAAGWRGPSSGSGRGASQVKSMA